MILLCGAVGLFIGCQLNRLADYLVRFGSVSRRALTAPQPKFMPTALLLSAELVFKRGPRPAKSFSVNVAVELLTAGLFSYLALRSGLSLNSLMLGLIGIFLILIALIDLRYRVILNVLIIPAAMVTLLLGLALREINLLGVLLGGGFGLAVFAFASFVRPGELGAGDVKLATLIGLTFGFPNVIMPLLVGVFAGGAAALVLILTRRGNRSTQIPYAPFLCMGALIGILYNPLAPFYLQR